MHPIAVRQRRGQRPPYLSPPDAIIVRQLIDPAPAQIRDGDDNRQQAGSGSNRVASKKLGEIHGRAGGAQPFMRVGPQRARAGRSGNLPSQRSRLSRRGVRRNSGLPEGGQVPLGVSLFLMLSVILTPPLTAPKCTVSEITVPGHPRGPRDTLGFSDMSILFLRNRKPSSTLPTHHDLVLETAAVVSACGDYLRGKPPPFLSAEQPEIRTTRFRRFLAETFVYGRGVIPAAGKSTARYLSFGSSAMLLLHVMSS